MKVLMYRSEGTDEMTIACRTVEEAVNCFRADAETLLHVDGDFKPEVWPAEITEEQFAAMQEM